MFGRLKNDLIRGGIALIIIVGVTALFLTVSPFEWTVDVVALAVMVACWCAWTMWHVSQRRKPKWWQCQVKVTESWGVTPEDIDNVRYLLTDNLGKEAIREDIIYAICPRRDKIYAFERIGIPLIAWVLLVLPAFFVVPDQSVTKLELPASWLYGFGVTGLSWLVAYYRSFDWTNRYLMVTNVHLVEARVPPVWMSPFMLGHVRRVRLTKVDTVSTDDTFFGQGAGYGTVLVDGPSSKGDEWANQLDLVPQAERMSDLLLSAIPD